MGAIWVLVWVCGWFLGFKALCAMDGKRLTAGGFFMNAITSMVFWFPISIFYVIWTIVKKVKGRIEDV